MCIPHWLDFYLTFEVSVKVFSHWGRKLALSYIILSYKKI